MNQLFLKSRDQVWALLFSLLGLCLAILAMSSAQPDLPAYEARYLIALMTLVLTVSVLINQRLRNPYVDILHIVFFLFYVVRAVALLMFPLTSDLLNPPLATGAVSYATTFLIFAFIALVVGCQSFLRRPLPEIGSLSPLDTSIMKAILWISTVIVLANVCYYIASYMLCNDLYQGIANSAMAILHAVFDSWRTLFFLVPILVLYGGFLSNLERLLAISNLALFVGVGIFIGLKSSVLQVTLYFLFPMVLRLSLSRGSRMRNLTLYFVLFTAIAICGFALGKTMRVVHLNNYGCSNGHSKIEMLGNVASVLEGQGSPNMGAAPSLGGSKTILQLADGFSYRTGYFDFTVEKLSNSAYASVVTFRQYFMAIVDKVTPGFDVFNVPFVSRSIYYAHHPNSVPGQMMNSEQLTLFGEAGLLFGWGAPLYFLLACWLLGLLHRFLHRLAGSNMLAKNLAFLFVLQLFYYWIEGMGLDMLFILHLLHTGIFTLGVLLLAWGVVAASAPHMKWQKTK